MISSRICGPDDQLAVRRFVCCGAGAPEYAMDVQRYIRGLDLKENADDVLRMALYCEGDPDYSRSASSDGSDLRTRTRFRI